MGGIWWVEGGRMLRWDQQRCSAIDWVQIVLGSRGLGGCGAAPSVPGNWCLVHGARMGFPWGSLELCTELRGVSSIAVSILIPPGTEGPAGCAVVSPARRPAPPAAGFALDLRYKSLMPDLSPPNARGVPLVLGRACECSVLGTAPPLCCQRAQLSPVIASGSGWRAGSDPPGLDQALAPLVEVLPVLLGAASSPRPKGISGGMLRTPQTLGLPMESVFDGEGKAAALLWPVMCEQRCHGHLLHCPISHLPASCQPNPQCLAPGLPGTESW